jgi:hypothetical protein
VKIDPATTPGNASGRSTLRKLCHGRAPRSAEASSSLAGTRSIAACIGRIMNGSHAYVNTRNRPRFDVESELPPMYGSVSRPSSAPRSPSRSAVL